MTVINIMVALRLFDYSINFSKPRSKFFATMLLVDALGDRMLSHTISFLKELSYRLVIIIKRGLFSGLGIAGV
jgi:hypothetical protein